MELVPSGNLHPNHRLSLGGKITLFNCKRAPTTVDNKSGELKFCSVSFKRELNQFLRAADGAAVISRKTCAHVDIVTCQCAIDVQKRATTPCVLVTKKGETGESFQYSLLTLSSSNELKPCVEFKLPYPMSGHVSILQGPTVVWRQAGCVFYTSLQAGEVRQIPFQLSHSVIGELPLHKGQVFVIGLQSFSEQSSNHPSTSPTLGYFLENGHMFDSNMLLPQPYICITKCILVISADLVDDVLRSAVVTATSNQQLVYFEDGIVKDTCQLPFETPEDIQVVHTGRNGVLFVISFHQGHVCAIWKDSFQVCKTWVYVSLY